MDLDALSLAATFGEDGLWHFTKSCNAGNSNFETRKFSELISARWCGCHRNANRFSTLLQDLAPLPDLFAQPVFHSPEEAATWAGLFLSVLKTTELISESSFQRAVELVHRIASPPRLPSSGTLVMVERGSRVEMVPHLFRTALHNALVHDPRGSSLVLVRQALPVSLFEGPSLLPSSLFHLVSLHAHRDEAERCAHLTMRLYDNGAAGLTPAEAYKAARALVENPKPVL